MFSIIPIFPQILYYRMAESGEADNDGDEAMREAQERLAERLQAPRARAEEGINGV